MALLLAGGTNVVAWWVGQRDLAATVRQNQTTTEQKLTEVSKSIDSLVSEQRVQSKSLSDAATSAVRTDAQLADQSRRLTRLETKVGL
jgi:hypothetical protein